MAWRRRRRWNAGSCLTCLTTPHIQAHHASQAHRPHSWQLAWLSSLRIMAAAIIPHSLIWLLGKIRSGRGSGLGGGRGWVGWAGWVWGLRLRHLPFPLALWAGGWACPGDRHLHAGPQTVWPVWPVPATMRQQHLPFAKTIRQ